MYFLFMLIIGPEPHIHICTFFLHLRLSSLKLTLYLCFVLKGLTDLGAFMRFSFLITLVGLCVPTAGVFVIAFKLRRCTVHMIQTVIV